MGDEGDFRSDRYRRFGLPLDGLDVVVPNRSVVGIGRKLSDRGYGRTDGDLSNDVDVCHLVVMTFLDFAVQ